MSAVVSPTAAASPEATEEPAAPLPATSDPSGEAPAVVDPAPPPPTAEDKVKLAAKTIARAKAAGARHRELEAKAEREALRAQQLSERLQQQEQERDRDRHERETWKKNPLEALKGMGLTARQLAQRALEEGTPDARFAALEAQLSEERAARTKLEERLASQQRTASEKAAVEQFLGRVKPESYPHLSRIPPGRVLAMARDVFAEAQRLGYTFRDADSEVLEQLESEFSPQSAPAGVQSRPGTNAGKTAAVPGATPPPTSRTVTSDLSGRRWSRPTNFDELDDYDQRKELARMLEQDYPPSKTSV
jgi:hypothetical protein